MLMRQIYDEKLAEYAYLIGCQQTGEALVIDPMRDIDRYVEIAEREGLKIVAVTETHIHADFLSGSREFAAQYGTRVYLSGEGGPEWSYEWMREDGCDFVLLKDGDVFRIGNIEFRALHMPGHTPEHLCFVVTDRGGGAMDPMGVATGDLVFVGDVGRPDLLETAAGVAGTRIPSARRLYASLSAFRNLPDYLQIWPGHGAGSACGKALGAVPQTTVGYERRYNGALRAVDRGENAFVTSILEGQPEPPPYFARMKRDNKLGPRVLGGLPHPDRLTVADLLSLRSRPEAVVLDTRLDRSAFMQHHLPGSLYAPLDRTFTTVAGSYVEEHVPIFLIVEEERVEEAVRALVSIGLDDVLGYAAPEMLELYREQGGTLASTVEITFEEMRGLLAADHGVPLDVRGRTEFVAGHVPGAEQVAHTRLLPQLGQLPRDRELLVYCRTGARAAVASAFLERNGFRVRYVNDLFENWSNSQTAAALA